VIKYKGRFRRNLLNYNSPTEFCGYSDDLPDYWEDVNGNGSLDSGETKPNDAADRGLRVFITRPKSGSTIP